MSKTRIHVVCRDCPAVEELYASSVRAWLVRQVHAKRTGHTVAAGEVTIP